MKQPEAIIAAFSILISIFLFYIPLNSHVSLIQRLQSFKCSRKALTYPSLTDYIFTQKIEDILPFSIPQSFHILTYRKTRKQHTQTVMRKQSTLMSHLTLQGPRLIPIPLCIRKPLSDV